MASKNDKIQALTNLLNDSHDIGTEYQHDLNRLKFLRDMYIFCDDQETIVIVEQWLKNRQPLYEKYQEQLNKLSSANSLLGSTGEKGIGGSKPQPDFSITVARLVYSAVPWITVSWITRGNALYYGIGGSKPQPNPLSSSLSEPLENITKPNTDLPPTPTPQ